jgi:hypothetical protein
MGYRWKFGKELKRKLHLTSSKMGGLFVGTYRQGR